MIKNRSDQSYFYVVHIELKIFVITFKMNYRVAALLQSVLYQTTKYLSVKKFTVQNLNNN